MSTETVEKADQASPGDLPLVVDVDGTLVRSDLLIETGFALLAHRPLELYPICRALLRGKAALKSEIAGKATMTAAALPYNEAVLALIAQARAAGRKVYLASASDGRYVSAIAEHLGLFDGWFASDGRENLSSRTKANLLVNTFGRGGFDYIGNSADDFEVWAVARKSIAIEAGAKIEKRLRDISPSAHIISRPPGALRQWRKLLRVHQWTKNMLLFVPLLTAQKFDVVSLAEMMFAVLFFSLAASSIYILNDLADLEADREHPSKRFRPLASGAIPLVEGLLAVPLLLLIALGGAALISLPFAGILLVYLVLTTAYTFYLKRRVILDVITLAGLYSVRVIAGSVAISVPVSEWLLAFSMFIFTSLALIKRYIDLATRIDEGLPDPSNRNYRKTDLDIVAALAAAAGFNAVTVFALYISSPNIHQLYSRPFMLWFICPILMWWLARALVLAHRREMNDDPVLFAIKDRSSLLSGIGILLLIFAAM